MYACLQLELLLTAATLSVAIVGVVSGLFGMNLTNHHENSYGAFIIVSLPIPTSFVVMGYLLTPWSSGYPRLISNAAQVSCSASGFAIFVFVAIFAYCRYKKLM